MTNVMNTHKEDFESFEKCRSYTVSVVECGKIGVLHAYLFAEAGFKIIGITADPLALKSLKKGYSSSFREANYKLAKYMKEGTFSHSSDVRKAASESDVVVIALPIAVDRRKKPDYSALERICKEIGMGLKKGSLVLFVSPTGPGIVEGILREILEKASGLRAGTDFALASSPIQTSSLDQSADAFAISRAVGAVDEVSLRTASTILKKITKSDVIEVSNIKTAEAINLFQNAKNETSQAIVNEFAFLCEKLKIDFLEVLRTTNRDAAFNLPDPGILNGLSRRDLHLLQEEAENANITLRLTPLARRINDEISQHTFHLVKDALKACGKTIRRSKVSVLGVSRRPDAKETPGALTKKIISLLEKKVRTVQIYDPFFSKKELAELGFKAEKLSKVVEKTDCLLILTAHSKFERLNLRKVSVLAKKPPAVVDIVHVVNPLKAEEHGFVYRGLGRGIWTK